MPRKKRLERKIANLTNDQEQHLTGGWALDACQPWCGIDNIGFPFRDANHRKELWFEHRDHLGKKYGDVTRLAGWHDYEATAKQRENFDWRAAVRAVPVEADCAGRLVSVEILGKAVEEGVEHDDRDYEGDQRV